jgi:hypothetical protein
MPIELQDIWTAVFAASFVEMRARGETFGYGVPPEESSIRLMQAREAADDADCAVAAYKEAMAAGDIEEPQV